MGWKKICNLDEAPENGMATFTVDGTEVLLVKGSDRYLVIPPLCPHMATPLCAGFFDGCVLTCNKHLWQWSIEDGQPMGIAEAPLLMYETKEADGAICANLDKELVYQHQCEVEE